MKLQKIRREIDNLDRRLVRILNKRTKLALIIGREKERHGVEVFAPEREREVYENIRHENSGPFPNKVLKSIYREIMSATIYLQTRR